MSTPATGSASAAEENAAITRQRRVSEREERRGTTTTFRWGSNDGVEATPDRAGSPLRIALRVLEQREERRLVDDTHPEALGLG